MTISCPDLGAHSVDAGREKGRQGALGAAADAALFLPAGHGAGTPAHRGARACSQESSSHLEHLCGISPARQAEVIPGPAPSGRASGAANSHSNFKTESFSSRVSTGTSGACERHLATRELS